MALQDLYDLYQPQDIEEQSWLSAMANSAWFAPIKFLGESLGKPQQALYGLAEGDFSALANLIPFSDTLGITSHVPGQGLIQTKQRSGRDLMRNWGIVGPEDNWGNFAAGLTMDILTDPLNFVTGPAGALTKGVKGGMAAEKAGTLLPRIGERIAAGQGGLMGLKPIPWYVEALTGTTSPVLPLWTGKIGQAIGTGLGNLSDWATLAKIPGTEIQPWAAVRSMFEHGAGHTKTGEYVLAAEKNKAANAAMRSEGIERALATAGESESAAINAAIRAGFSGPDAENLANIALRSAIESGEATLPLVSKGRIAPEIISDAGVDYVKFSNEGGYLNAEVSGDKIKLINTQVPLKENRGKGFGSDLYDQALEFASERGLRVVSDSSVTPEAQRIYDSLRKRGFDVSETPGASVLGSSSKFPPPGTKFFPDEKTSIFEIANVPKDLLRSQEGMIDPKLANAIRQQAKEYADKAQVAYAGERADVMRLGGNIEEATSRMGFGYNPRKQLEEMAQVKGSQMARKEWKDFLTTEDINELSKNPATSAIMTSKIAGDMTQHVMDRNLIESEKYIKEFIQKKAADRLEKGLIPERSRVWAMELVNDRPWSDIPPRSSAALKRTELVREAVDKDAQAIRAAAQQAGIDPEDIIDVVGSSVGAVPKKWRPNLPEKTGPIVGPATKAAQEMADYFAKLPPQVADRGGMFGKSVTADAMRYMGKSLPIQKATLNNILKTMEMQAGDFGSMVAKADDASKVMSLKQALETLGMQTGAEELAARMGIKEADLASKGISSKLVEKLNLEKQGPPPAGRLLQGLDKLTTAFRYGTTVPWISNLTRNWVDAGVNIGLSGSKPWANQSIAQAFRRGGLTDAAQLAKAEAAWKEGLKYGLFEDQLGELIGKGTTRAGEVGFNIAPIQSGDRTARKALAENLGLSAPTKAGEAARRAEGIVPLREKFPESTLARLGGKVVDPVRGWFRGMERAHQFQNETTRLAQLMSLMDEGWSPAAAAQRVHTSQLDYSRLTPFERDVMRNVVPFYNFTSQNTIRLANQFSRDPGPITSLIKFANSGRQDDSFVPSYVSSGAAVPMPGADPGQQRFLASFGLSIEDEMVGALAALGAMRPTEAIRRAASSSNPLIKSIYEMASGTQLFSGRKLEDLKPSGALSALGVPDAASKFISQAVQATPVSRVFSTADRLAEADKKGLATNFLNLLTGARVVDVDQQVATSIAARQAIEAQLNRSPYYRTKPQIVMESQYKGQEDQIPPEMLQLMEAYRAMQEKARLAAKEKFSAR